MLVSELLLDCDDVACSEEFLFGCKAVPPDLHEFSWFAMDVTVPIAFTPDRYDADATAAGFVSIDPQGGPVGLAAAAPAWVTTAKRLASSQPSRTW
jgi:hypothetical protein